jgi:pimeloyl-ACP methyl ester carboxylesterase
MSESSKRYLTMQYDEKGNPQFSCPLSPTEQTRRAHCVVPPTDVIPVIFVPGFMGSNLKTSASVRPFSPGETFWKPDDTGLMTNKIAPLNPAQRQLLFSPTTTTVASVDRLPRHLMQYFNVSGREFARPGDDIVDNLLGEFKRRGWGELYLGSYGRLLATLEARLNRIYSQGKLEHAWQTVIEQANNLFRDNEMLAQHGVPAVQNRAKGWSPLTDADLKAAARHWFPVHAFGYNWLQGADESGKALAKRIDTVIDNYASEGYACSRVILVTHSMGGIVARAACHPNIGSAQDHVLGVVQGVCPTAGAPAIYQRMRTGHAKGIFLEFVKNKVAEILGTDAAMVTPVLGNSPGALSLLPTAAYPPGWLAIDGVGALPKTNPYAEIYRERNGWWKLVKEELLNPARKQSADSTPWDSYLRSIRVAEVVQERLLKDFHHPNTYTHYSVSANDETVATLRWRRIGGAITHSERVQLIRDDLKGKVTLSTAEGSPLELALARAERARGDGTVPAESAAVSEKGVRFSAALETYFEHSDSYDNTGVIALTLHNITRMAAKA